MPAGDGFSPIIDAIVNWQTQKRQAAAQELDKKKQAEVERSNKVQEQQRQQQLDQARKEIDQQHELDKLRTDAQRDTNYAALIDQLTKSAKSGVDLSTLSKTDEGGNQYFEAPSGLKIPMGLIPDYKKQGQIQNEADFNKAFNTTSGQMQAKEPYEIAASLRQQNLADLKHKWDIEDATKLENLRQQGRSQELAMEIGSRERIAKWNNQVDRERIQRTGELALKTGDQNLSNAVEQYVDATTIDGSLSLNQVPAAKGIRNLVAARAKELGRTFLDKSANSLLQALPVYKELTALLQDYADVNSGTGRISNITGLSFGPTNKEGVTAAGLRNQIEAYSPQLIKFLGDTGNLSESDRKSLNNLVGRFTSQSDNQKAVQELQDIIKRTAQGALRGMSSEQRNQVLASRGIDAEDIFGKESTPLVKTKAEFDALPKGAKYMEEDGNVYIK